MNRYRVYEANSTMKILGEQYCITPTDCPQLKDIEKAYTDDKKPFFSLYRLAFHACMDMIIDVFNLGIIYGIRKERERRKCH